MRKIILLSGWSTSGKDLLADYLVKNGYTQFSFASILKKKVSDHYKFDYDLTLTQKGKNTKINGITIRELLISYAKTKRNKNDDIFVEYTLNEIKLLDSYKTKRGEPLSDIVISDLRYNNEIEFLKKRFKNCITIRINRHNKSPVDDISEHQLDSFNFDYIIENKGTKKDLFKAFTELQI